MHGLFIYLTSPIEVDTINCQIIALVIFDFFIEFLVDWVRVKDERRETWKSRQILYRRHVVHEETVVEGERIFGRYLLA